MRECDCWCDARQEGWRWEWMWPRRQQRCAHDPALHARTVEAPSFLTERGRVGSTCRSRSSGVARGADVGLSLYHAVALYVCRSPLVKPTVTPSGHFLSLF